MPYGILKPPLGLRRLKIVEFVATIVALGYRESLQKVMEVGVVQRCLDLFREYPHNNLLHGCVTNMIIAGIGCSEEDFKLHIFEECQLVDWITTLPMEVVIQGGSGKPIQAGYRGHVVQIAERLCHLATDNFQIQQYLEEHQWPVFFVNVLQPAIKRNDTKNWRCGRPPRSLLMLGSEDWSDAKAIYDNEEDEDDEDDDEDEVAVKVPVPYNPVDEEEEEESQQRGKVLTVDDEEEDEGEAELVESDIEQQIEEDEMIILPTRISWGNDSDGEVNFNEEDDEEEDDDDEDEQQQQRGASESLINQSQIIQSEDTTQQQQQLQQSIDKYSSDKASEVEVTGANQLVIIKDIEVGDPEFSSWETEEGSTGESTSSETSNSSDGSGPFDSLPSSYS
eukprot:TRINITY_DN1329_c0_g1_i14.p1 TRINITY_DN1329_c0_g1~~TRINITY_DN1329_c0_g1_i14.p1  ORF type:complete len:393 (+),score=89.54 TRINITY_DN1329_c0_g1_i14:203-1381(+)